MNNMLWQEMSYQIFTQIEEEPEVWDEIYEPTLEEWTEWILE